MLPKVKRGTVCRVESKMVSPVGSLIEVDTLHEVVGDVKRYEFEEKFGWDG
jgi:hypothetical protein